MADQWVVVYRHGPDTFVYTAVYDEAEMHRQNRLCRRRHGSAFCIYAEAAWERGIRRPIWPSETGA